jgi:Uma2 family endonuclease
MPVLTDKSIPDGPYRLSVDEYLELPDDGKRYQILDGVLDVTPAPSPRHQRVSRRLL